VIFSSIRVLPGMKQPPSSVASTDSSSLSTAQRPSSVISVAVATASVDRVPRPLSVIPVAAPTTSADSALLTSNVTVASTGADTVPTADKLPPSTASDVIVDTAQDVAVTSSITSVGGTSSILAQLSYAQPSIELLRRRRAADTVDTVTVNTSTTGPTHLLSSATQAALAALASTPRRYVNNLVFATGATDMTFIFVFLLFIISSLNHNFCIFHWMLFSEKLTYLFSDVAPRKMNPL